MPAEKKKVHCIDGAFVGGYWEDIEDCVGKNGGEGKFDAGMTSAPATPCPRSRTRTNAAKEDGSYDVIIIGAGCIGSAIARELSKYKLSVIMVEAADDVTQGATKGNSGIVHAGYDDKPGSIRAKFCWPGNQMFPQLDRELHFGYQKNGSLVVATDDKEVEVLHELMERGRQNGVQNLRILNREELFRDEPNMNPNCIAALFAPDAGNVIPYEYAIALAENAADNGVEIRIRRQVTAISREQEPDGQGKGLYTVTCEHWEPRAFVKPAAPGARRRSGLLMLLLSALPLAVAMGAQSQGLIPEALASVGMAVSGGVSLLMAGYGAMLLGKKEPELLAGTGGTPVTVDQMHVGGSGSAAVMGGVVVATERIRARFVVNAAGTGSDVVARMVGDDSFKIMPRLGEYILLKKTEGGLVSRTIFPAPDPKLGKGVLVQTTLWGNLILGPTARDTYNREHDMSADEIKKYILSKCKILVPKFDVKQTFHTFSGARAKNSEGDWIIRPAASSSGLTADGSFVHAAGIDSPGLAGSPAIAAHVVDVLLRGAGLRLTPDPAFNPVRRPIVRPKLAQRGGKFALLPSGGGEPIKLQETSLEEAATDPLSNVVCKCEWVTEAEVVEACRRSLPIDSTQAIRKRTRAGMGRCQAEAENYGCEARVAAIIARETSTAAEQVGRRPWPATSMLPQRWLTKDDKDHLEALSRATD